LIRRATIWSTPDTPSSRSRISKTFILQKS
jgi:hypothetical protein